MLLGQGLEAVVYYALGIDLGGRGVVHVQLQLQAFAQVAGAHTNGLEALNDLEYALQLIRSGLQV